jgi:hypothetical protein
MFSMVAALIVWRYLPASSSAALSSTVAREDHSISLQSTFASLAASIASSASVAWARW